MAIAIDLTLNGFDNGHGHHDLVSQLMNEDQQLDGLGVGEVFDDIPEQDNEWLVGEVVINDVADDDLVILLIEVVPSDVGMVDLNPDPLGV